MKRWLVAGLQRDGGVLPDALPGGPGERRVRARPQARHHRPGAQLARRRRPRLRLVALVAALRPDAAVSAPLSPSVRYRTLLGLLNSLCCLPQVGLRPGGQRGDEGHGQNAGIHQGAAHLGEMGRRQPRQDQHQSLLPGDLTIPLQVRKKVLLNFI
jgi:hypothetical protein